MEKVEAVTDFIFLGSKSTVDVDCSHEIKRHLLLGRKAMTNLDSILKIRYVTLPTKVHIIKALVFPVVTYGCENWTIEKGEHQELMLLVICFSTKLISWIWKLSRHVKKPKVVKVILRKNKVGGLSLSDINKPSKELQSLRQYSFTVRIQLLLEHSSVQG